jgi:hypothetical protein
MTLSNDQLRQAFPLVEGGAFRSHNELIAAISSPLYTNDASYRDRVGAKLAKTDRASWGLSNSRAPIRYTSSPAPVTDEGFSW